MEIRTRNNEVPQDLIEALDARRAGLGNLYLSSDDAWEEHIGQMASMAYTPREAREMVDRETEMRAKGIEYFEQGYRLKRLPRQEVWHGYKVPEDAVSWGLESAGYRAMSECHRLVYAIKKS